MGESTEDEAMLKLGADEDPKVSGGRCLIIDFGSKADGESAMFLTLPLPISLGEFEMVFIRGIDDNRTDPEVGLVVLLIEDVLLFTETIIQNLKVHLD